MQYRHTDVGNGGSYSHFDARVTFLRQLTLEELVQFGIEDTIGDELAAFRDSTSLNCGHDCGVVKEVLAVVDLRFVEFYLWWGIGLRTSEQAKRLVEQGLCKWKWKCKWAVTAVCSVQYWPLTQMTAGNFAGVSMIALY